MWVVDSDIRSGGRGPFEELLDQLDQPPAGEHTQHVGPQDQKDRGHAHRPVEE